MHGLGPKFVLAIEHKDRLYLGIPGAAELKGVNPRFRRQIAVDQRRV